MASMPGRSADFGHDASRLTANEAARIAAIFPLPKRRQAIAPTGFTRRYGNMILARMAVVRRDRLDACVYAAMAAPVEAPEPARPVRRAPRVAPTTTPVPPRHRPRCRARSLRNRSSRRPRRSRRRRRRR